MPRAARSPWNNEDRSDAKLRSAAYSMIVARRALHGPLPSGILHDTPLDVLLRLFVAEDHAVPLAALQADMTMPDAVVRRWLAALGHDGMVAIDGTSARLTAPGHDAMVRAIDAVIQSQIDLFGTAVHA